MGNDIGGYVLIYRRLLDHTAFRTDAEAMAFAWMVLRASWRQVDVRYKDRTITLQRGQLAMSVRDMATHLERSKDWANRFLQRLTDRDMVTVDSATGVTIISIKNYNSFQLDPKNQCDRPATEPRQDRDTTATQNNEGNEENEEKELETAKRASRLSSEWTLPDEWREFAKQKRGWSDDDVSAEAEEFRDYWVAVPGAKGVKVDWLATWRNWVRRSFRKPSAPARSNPLQMSKPMAPHEQVAYERMMKGVI